MNPPRDLYGLIGFPVTHSLSPLMHNAAFAYLSLNAEYKLFEVKPEELQGFVSLIIKKDIRGLNVTIPHKEKVMPYLQSISPEAKIIGAVNTIKIHNNRLEGHNTDGEGFLRHLTSDLSFDPAGKTISILGAGGAAKAVSVVLAKCKPRVISIYDVETPKAKSLVAHLQEHCIDVRFKAADSLGDLDIPGSQLLVNATPIGMKVTDPCIVDEKVLHSGILVYDVIYNPAETQLLKAAAAKGAKVSNGLGMLLYQGVRAFEIWTGFPAPVEVMRQALSEGATKL